MKNVVGVKFKKEGKIYTFDAVEIPLAKNDQVVVNTDTLLDKNHLETIHCA